VSEAPAPKAWFRQFWPWFIVGLLAVSVVGSLATVVIAYRHGDVEVARTGSAPPPDRFGRSESRGSAPASDAGDLREVR